MKTNIDLANLPETLTGHQTRQLAGLSAVLWMEMLEQGSVPDPVKVGDRWKWRKADVLRWVADMQARGMFS